jgi:hypothetical protein
MNGIDARIFLCPGTIHKYGFSGGAKGPLAVRKTGATQVKLSVSRLEIVFEVG